MKEQAVPSRFVRPQVEALERRESPVSVASHASNAEKRMVPTCPHLVFWSTARTPFSFRRFVGKMASSAPYSKKAERRGGSSLMRLHKWTWATSFLLSIVFAASIPLLRQWCFSGKVTSCSFSRISVGLTLEEVEQILGPGTEVQAHQVPTIGQSRFVNGRLSDKVVEGDRFFSWQTDDNETYWIGFVDNSVFEKAHSVVPLF